MAKKFQRMGKETGKKGKENESVLGEREEKIDINMEGMRAAIEVCKGKRKTRQQRDKEERGKTKRQRKETERE